MGADLSAINIVRHGVFSVKSFTNNESERYNVDFGDDETMLKCTCQDWALSYYPCKHFFAVFRKYIPWQWDALSPPYINSPFLTLDNLDDTAENNNIVKKSNENKAEFNAGNSNQNEFFAETSNENRTDECIEEPIHSDEERVVFTEISRRKRAKANLHSECCELLERLKNATFDVEESSEVFVELNSF